MAWFSDVPKNLGKNLKQVAGQAARKFASQLVDEVTARHYVDKKFINIRDFYNFTKHSSGANAPTDFWYFSVNFYQHSEVLSNEPSYGKAYTDEFFGKYDEQLMRLRFGIQMIQFPALELKSLSTDNGVAGGNAYENVSTLYGGYNVLNNSFIHAAQREITMTILEFQSPVIENFIYPWMEEAVRTRRDEKDKSLFPKLNMAVKYWAPNNTFRDMEGVAPDFVYYVTGLFPVSISTVTPKMVKGENTRTVRFSFNDFIILNSKSDAAKYNLFELFVTSTYDNMFNTVVDKANKGLEKLISKGEKGLGKVLDKALVAPLEKVFDPHGKNKEDGKSSSSSSGSSRSTVDTTDSILDQDNSSQAPSSKSVRDALEEEKKALELPSEETTAARDNGWISYSFQNSPKVPASSDTTKTAQDIDAEAPGVQTQTRSASASASKRTSIASAVEKARSQSSSASRADMSAEQKDSSKALPDVLEQNVSDNRLEPAQEQVVIRNELESAISQTENAKKEEERYNKTNGSSLLESPSSQSKPSSSPEASRAARSQLLQSLQEAPKRKDTSSLDTVKYLSSSPFSGKLLAANRMQNDTIASSTSRSSVLAAGSFKNTLPSRDAISQARIHAAQAEVSQKKSSQSLESLLELQESRKDNESFEYKSELVLDEKSSKHSGENAGMSIASVLQKARISEDNDESFEERSSKTVKSATSNGNGIEPFIERWKGKHLEVDEETHHLKQYVVPEKTREETLGKISQADIDDLF